MAEHPIEALRQAGFVITVSPDNRLMSRTTTSGEFRLLTDRPSQRDLSAYTERPAGARDTHPVVSAFIGGSVDKIRALRQKERAVGVKVE